LRPLNSNSRQENPADWNGNVTVTVYDDPPKVVGQTQRQRLTPLVVSLPESCIRSHLSDALEPVQVSAGVDWNGDDTMPEHRHMSVLPAVGLTGYACEVHDVSGLATG